MTGGFPDIGRRGLKSWNPKRCSYLFKNQREINMKLGGQLRWDIERLDTVFSGMLKWKSAEVTGNIPASKGGGQGEGIQDCTVVWVRLGVLRITPWGQACEACLTASGNVIKYVSILLLKALHIPNYVGKLLHIDIGHIILHTKFLSLFVCVVATTSYLVRPLLRKSSRGSDSPKALIFRIYGYMFSVAHLRCSHYWTN